MVEVAGCGQGHGDFRMVSGPGNHVVWPRARAARQQPQESHSVTFATAKGAVPKFTFGILTLPLGHSNFGSYEPGGAPASQGKKKPVFHVKHPKHEKRDK